MSSFIEYCVYYSVKALAFLVRCLPLSVSLWFGRMIGLMGYYFDVKHKSLAYSNLKLAFAKTKSPTELKKITKDLFKNFGQNLIELFRLPLLHTGQSEEIVTVEGREHVQEALKKKEGVILLAMHFGSWELSSMACGTLGRPYNVMVKPQKRMQKLDELLNSYRSCGGSVVISRGAGTRELIKSLRNNEIIGMVVDQGGRDGVLVPFFGRQASMSVGAIRLGLKLGTPICFSIIIRANGNRHRLVIDKPLELEKTGDTEKDVVTNLKKIMTILEGYITRYPSEYMWFYKIWKYSKESSIAILSDGKTGHLRQSETVAHEIQKALMERNIHSTIETLNVSFQNEFSRRAVSLLSVLLNSHLYQGRLGFMKLFLTEKSFKEVMGVKADFIVSCGSAMAGVNRLLALDHHAKSVVVLKPGVLDTRDFHLVFLPYHDWPRGDTPDKHIVVTRAAPNLITSGYLNEKTEMLLQRFSHLRSSHRMKIGVFLGGSNRHKILKVSDIKVLVHQLKAAAEELQADILMTTSRRTSPEVEKFLQQEMKEYVRCPLLILANQNNTPEAVGGILGLADIVIVSGESISMISEAASSGKQTIVFNLPNRKENVRAENKYDRFIAMLNEKGHVLTTDVATTAKTVVDVAKNKIQTKPLDDREVIFEAVRRII